MASWSFLSNHGLILAYIGRYPDSTGLAIAQAIGITERAARKIVSDLLTEGYIQREKVGRRNRYRMNPNLMLRHPVERTVTVGELLRVLLRDYNRSGCDSDHGNVYNTPDQDIQLKEAMSPMPGAPARGVK